MKRLRKIALMAAIAVLLVWGGLYTTSVYRIHKAQHLLSEIRTLSPSVSAADVQKIVTSYSGKTYRELYGDSPPQECTPAACTYEFIIENAGPFRVLAQNVGWDYIGLRPWSFHASIST